MRVEGNLSTAHLHHVRTRQDRIVGAIIIDHEDGLLIRPDHAEELITSRPSGLAPAIL
jgi:hypothetical protein